MSDVTLAREIAYDAFSEVMAHKAKPEKVLEKLYKLHEKNLSRLDKNFIKEMVYGSLRWYSKILWILQHTASRKLDESPQPVRTALVLGTYQIFYMNKVPDRAAVNESVEYVRKKSLSSACSFVNGILRQISRRAEYFAKPDKVTHPVDYLSLQFAHPKWIVERWQRQFKFERLEALLESNNEPPPNSIRINVLKTQFQDSHILQQNLLKHEKTHSERRPLRSCLRLKEAPNLGEDSFFAKGFYTIQDEAAQVVSLLVAPKPEEIILDACAGPGGKLTHIFELSEGKAEITGIEPDEEQFKKIQDNCQRLECLDKIKLEKSSFLDFKSRKKFDKILLDSPCTGLGVLRRHPEGKWHKDSTIINSMAAKQREFIKHALSLLKVGGELIFSVCSFELEENYDHWKWLQKTYGSKVELISPISRVPDFYKKYVTRDNILVIYSGNQDQMDGFSAFIVKLKEKITDEKP